MESKFTFRLKESFLNNSNIKERVIYLAEAKENGSVYQISFGGEMVEYSRAEVDRYVSKGDWVIA